MHLTISLKNAPFIYHQSGRLSISKNLSGRMDLNSVIGNDIAVNLSTNDDIGDMHIGLNHSSFTNNKASIGRYLPPKMTVYPDSTMKCQLSLELCILP